VWNQPTPFTDYVNKPLLRDHTTEVFLPHGLDRDNIVKYIVERVTSTIVKHLKFTMSPNYVKLCSVFCRNLLILRNGLANFEFETDH
jgi:hypothetical protein